MNNSLEFNCIDFECENTIFKFSLILLLLFILFIRLFLGFIHKLRGMEFEGVK